MAQVNDAGNEQDSYESTFGKAVGKGILIGLPIAFVTITLALLFFTDRDLAGAASTAFLPGVLLGVFGGGFAGMAIAME